MLYFLWKPIPYIALTRSEAPTFRSSLALKFQVPGTSSSQIPNVKITHKITKKGCFVVFFNIWHFYHWHFTIWSFFPMAFLQKTFLLSDIFTTLAFFPDGMFTTVFLIVWHFYHWHLYHLVFFPDDIFTNDIFTIWHFYHTGIFSWWHVYHWFFNHLTFLPLSFLP